MLRTNQKLLKVRKVNNKKEMAEKMQYIIEHPSITKNIGKKGLERIKKYYSWDIFFTKFDKKLKQIKTQNIENNK